MEVIWSDLAIESLSSILHYIQNTFGTRIANNVARKLIKFVALIGTTPYIGKKIEYLPLVEVRCENHIYYMIFENRIEIILIWDGRQDPRQLHSLLVSFFNK